MPNRNQPYVNFTPNGRGVVGDLLVQESLVVPSSFVDGVTITGDGSPGNPLVAAGGGGTVITDGVTIGGDGSVGAPIASLGVAVDGSTITGTGLPGDPLVASGGGGGGAVPDGVTIVGDGTIGDPLTGAGGPGVNIIFDEEWTYGLNDLGTGKAIGSAGWYGEGNLSSANVTSGKVGVLSMYVDNPAEFGSVRTTTMFRPDQADQLVFETRVALSAISNGVLAAFGFVNVGPWVGGAAGPANPAGAWWVLDPGSHANGSPGGGSFWQTWRGDYDAGSGDCVITSAVTSVPAVALGNEDGSGGPYIDLKIVIDQLANNVRFYANGALVSTLAGTIVLPPAPGPTTREGFYAQHVLRGAGALGGSKYVFVDYTRLSVIGINRFNV